MIDWFLSPLIFVSPTTPLPPPPFPPISLCPNLNRIQSRTSRHFLSFPNTLTPSLNEPLVIQYEVKLQHGLECGGAYIKLLTEESVVGEEEKGLRAGEEYTDKTPFSIMFGPDKCGSTNKGKCFWGLEKEKIQQNLYDWVNARGRFSSFHLPSQKPYHG